LLLVPLLNVDAQAVLRDGDLLGRLIDTFVVARLVAIETKAAAAVNAADAWHLAWLRDPPGRGFRRWHRLSHRPSHLPAGRANLGDADRRRLEPALVMAEPISSAQRRYEVEPTTLSLVVGRLHPLVRL
jgi:hypothetical protein